MEFNLGFANIVELGDKLSEMLGKNGIETMSELIVYLDDNEFIKVDEDLFYRNRKDESEKFIPSDDEIDITFDLVKIIIRKKRQDE